MFSLYNTYAKTYAHPRSGLKPLEKLGKVRVNTKGKVLGSGTFHEVSCNAKGRKHRVHFTLSGATLSPEGCAYVEGEYGPRCLANFILTKDQEEQLLKIRDTAAKDLLSTYGYVDEVEMPITTLTDDKTKTIQVKVTPRTTGNILKGVTGLEKRADEINKHWNTDQKVDVECVLTGLYYSESTEKIKMCISTVSVNKHLSASARKRSVSEVTANPLKVKRAKSH